MPGNASNGEFEINAAATFDAPQLPKPLHCKSSMVSIWPASDMIALSSHTNRSSSAQSLPAPGGLKFPTFKKFTSVKDGLYSAVAWCNSLLTRLAATALQHSPRRPNWKSIRIILPLALLLVHWAAMSATCLGFYLVVIKSLAGRPTVNVNHHNINTALIGSCVYFACISALLLILGVRIACERPRTRWHPLFLMSALFVRSHTIPEGLDMTGCPSPVEAAVLQAQWSKVKHVVWDVYGTLLLHTVLWFFLWPFIADP
ncbi:hypothetical protein DFH09DRAFT_1219568 [Mycena vulgaris]|nr:hypothetical protein DFH09DRAFT_1219568 [Mycena vulgaris]